MGFEAHDIDDTTIEHSLADALRMATLAGNEIGGQLLNMFPY